MQDKQNLEPIPKKSAFDKFFDVVLETAFGFIKKYFKFNLFFFISVKGQKILLYLEIIRMSI